MNEPAKHAVLDWEPCDTEHTNIAAFAALASSRAGRDLRGSYADLWRWSIEDLDGFWQCIWDFSGMPKPASAVVLADPEMPGAQWFPGSTLNYAEEILRDRDRDAVALVVIDEVGRREDVSWGSLEAEVAQFADYLRSVGVTSDDVVVGYLPNGREAVVALLATAAVGGIWAVCGLDYSAAAALTRFEQLEPVVLVTTLTHSYAGVERDRTADAAALVAGLPSVRHVVYCGESVPGSTSWADAIAGRSATLEVEHVAFDHPLWVLFSSGTTGRPKGIVHGHGGVILEYVKQAELHWDLGPGERLFWYSSPSWMMWNFCVSSLVSGASIVCYDGSPAHPDTGALWKIAESVGATVVGTSPAYLDACRKADLNHVGYPALRAVGVTGSAFASAAHRWLRSTLGPSVQIVSSSGGTDVVSAFAAGAPSLPVWEGELSGPCLGVDLVALGDSGAPVIDAVGELVVRSPMPSMPVRFWADTDGSRYRKAYFAEYPGLWRHGDWVTLTSRGSVVVHGRSDATLNRNGIRMGTADIYGPVEALPEIAEALVVGVELSQGGYWMPMFVALAEGATPDDGLPDRIAAAIRAAATPRHVPDEVVIAPGIPHTRTGKKLEVPVKNLLLGLPLATVADTAGVDAPEVLQWYADFASRVDMARNR